MLNLSFSSIVMTKDCTSVKVCRLEWWGKQTCSTLSDLAAIANTRDPTHSTQGWQASALPTELT